MQELKDLWQSVIARLETKFSPITVDLWFRDAELVLLDDDTAVISHTSPLKKSIIEKHYIPSLAEAFTEVLGFPVKIFIRLTGDAAAPVFDSRPGEEKNGGMPKAGSSGNGSDFSSNSDPERKTGFPNRGGIFPDTAQKSLQDAPTPPDSSRPGFQNDSDSSIPGGAELSSPKTSLSESYPPFNNEYTFENFVVGNSNKFAHAACTAVAANPAREYNPLFIYGSSGLGKTHLLNAIMNEIRKNYPNVVIIYVKGDEFTNQMIESIATKSQEKFRAKYRKADVLLIDDIQFIAGKDSTQEEFFHTFNALYEDRKQIIMTSDRPPRDIKTLEDRLKTRFEWGLIADIQPPDFELRIAIMRNKANMIGMTLPDEVLTLIAENLKSNIRQIEGAIKRICARSFLNGDPITVELAKSCISEFIAVNDPPEITAKKIVETVSKKYGIPTDEIYGRKRTKPISNARNVSIYIIRKITSLSLTYIAQIFDRDHTTIMSAIRSVEGETRSNPLLDIEINEMIKEITE